LQSAIQGKLVPQDSKDEPASVLLERIRTEKEKLVKAGKIKKEKPLPEIGEDEVPFDLPMGWEWVRLGKLINLISGVSYEKNDVAKSGIRILRGGNILDTRILINDDDIFLPKKYKNADNTIQIGDIIIVASTGSKAVIGKPGFVIESLPNTQIGAFLRIVRPINMELSKYLQILFSSEFYRERIRTLSQGTNINNIKAEYITEFVIPIPPLAEQCRIVAQMDNLLLHIDNYHQSSHLICVNRKG
jgi:type I restriction enzyme S subunit